MPVVKSNDRWSHRKGHRKEFAPAVIRVTAGIIGKDGLVLLARRPRFSRLAGLWEFPGGKIEKPTLYMGIPKGSLHIMWVFRMCGMPKSRFIEMPVDITQIPGAAPCG